MSHEIVFIPEIKENWAINYYPTFYILLINLIYSFLNLFSVKLLVDNNIEFQKLIKNMLNYEKDYDLILLKETIQRTLHFEFILFII